MRTGPTITLHRHARDEIGVPFAHLLDTDETIVSGASLIVFDKSDADVTDAFLEAASVDEDGKTVAAWKVSADTGHVQPFGRYRLQATGTTSKGRTLIELMDDSRFPVLVIVDGFQRP